VQEAVEEGKVHSSWRDDPVFDLGDQEAPAFARVGRGVLSALGGAATLYLTLEIRKLRKLPPSLVSDEEC